jgi:hypothetical protein
MNSTARIAVRIRDLTEVWNDCTDMTFSPVNGRVGECLKNGCEMDVADSLASIRQSDKEIRLPELEGCEVTVPKGKRLTVGVFLKIRSVELTDVQNRPVWDLRSNLDELDSFLIDQFKDFDGSEQP